MEIIPQLVANSIIAGAIYALVALGFNLIYGTTKFFDLGYGAITVVGGYGAFFFIKRVGLEPYMGIILGVIIAATVNYLIYRFIYKPLRARGASNVVMLVASLGVFTAIQAFIAILFTSQFFTIYNFSNSKIFEIPFSFIGDGTQAVMTGVQISILVAGIIVSGLLFLTLMKTKFGRAVRAIGDDEEVAKVVGINTSKIIGIVFMIGGAIAGLAGIAVGFDTGIEPTMGLNLLLKGVVAAIIGGAGNVYGGFLGAFLLGFVENFGIWKISGEWKDAIAFGLLIVFLLFRPQGILGKKA